MFFGRDDEIDRLLEAVRRRTAGGPIRCRRRPVGQRQVFANASRAAAASGAPALKVGGVACLGAGPTAELTSLFIWPLRLTPVASQPPRGDRGSAARDVRLFGWPSLRARAAVPGGDANGRVNWW